ncbi:MAG: hypothetical protein R2731_10605 [Nocardioides sp.]
MPTGTGTVTAFEPAKTRSVGGRTAGRGALVASGFTSVAGVVGTAGLAAVTGGAWSTYAGVGWR